MVPDAWHSSSQQIPDDYICQLLLLVTESFVAVSYSVLRVTFFTLIILLQVFQLCSPPNYSDVELITLASEKPILTGFMVVALT
jgi:hypothetical protein